LKTKIFNGGYSHLNKFMFQMVSPLRDSGRTKSKYIPATLHKDGHEIQVPILCADVKVVSHPGFTITHTQRDQKGFNLVARVETKYKKNELVGSKYTFTEDVLQKLEQSSQLVG